MRFRLAPNLSTLDALERPKRPLAEVNKNSGAHQKNFKEVGKCIGRSELLPEIGL